MSVLEFVGQLASLLRVQPSTLPAPARTALGRTFLAAVSCVVYGACSGSLSTMSLALSMMAKSGGALCAMSCVPSPALVRVCNGVHCAMEVSELREVTSG